MNSGDWVENLTALEYNNHEWTVFQYEEKNFKQEIITTKSRSESAQPSLNVLTDEISLFLNSLILPA